MTIYIAAFAAVAVSAEQDVFEIVAPNVAQHGFVTIRRIFLGQYTDFGDAAAEILSVQLIRGFTTSGTGGAAVTPYQIIPASKGATSSIERNNTGLATDGTGQVLHAESFNVQAGWWYDPAAEERIVLNASLRRLVVRITAPADAVTLNGTMIFEEHRMP